MFGIVSKSLGTDKAARSSTFHFCHQWDGWWGLRDGCHRFLQWLHHWKKVNYFLFFTHKSTIASFIVNPFYKGSAQKGKTTALHVHERKSKTFHHKAFCATNRQRFPYSFVLSSFWPSVTVLNNQDLACFRMGQKWLIWLSKWTAPDGDLVSQRWEGWIEEKKIVSSWYVIDFPSD